MLPAIIRKVHEAKLAKQPSITLWGTGEPRREFLFVDDLAQACLFLLNLDDKLFKQLLAQPHGPVINIGTGCDLTIAELAVLVKEVVGYEGSVLWDSSRPNGTMRKLLEISQLQALGWKASTTLEQGVRLTYAAFNDAYSSCAEPI